MSLPKLLPLCLFVGVVLQAATLAAAKQSILRDDPRLPKQGTKNWELLEGNKFTPRHSHATTIFKCPPSSPSSGNSTGAECIWLTGGYSESHRTYQGDTFEHENPDVWWSEDGAQWNQITELYGDYIQGVGNHDAKVGGYVAPWYSRYGHSLNTLDGNGDGTADVMILTGGFSPIPSNDVWTSRDGITWRFDGYAPWPKRAYHGAVAMDNKLWVLGGTPLSNDVWVGSLVEDKSRDVGYKLVWEQKTEAPWTPRAGFCAVTQLRRDSLTNATAEHMYIIGGLAHSREDTPASDDGTRARNDVWKTTDGITWEQVLPSGKDVPWGARAFHGCTTWHSLDDRSRWVGADPDDHLIGDNSTFPRIFMTGGGYMGTRGNSVARELEAYTDTWWSRDGTDWVRVNYEEGSKHNDNVYSTNEWTETTIEGRKIYRGKWGHTLEALFHNKGSDENEVEETPSPSLFVIGGKLESEHLVSDVFVSLPGLLCEQNGLTCGGKGRCGPETQGCICPAGSSAGDYC